MIVDTVCEKVLQQQKLVGRELTFEEVVDLIDGTPEEIWTGLQQMHDDGYLFFDGETVMVY